MHRITAGLYYDVCAGPQNLIAEANNRFERYAEQLIQAFCPRFALLGSQSYGPKKSQFASPDVLLKDGNQIVAVFECKATKLTYSAQFAENPISEAEKAYNQLVKGVTQLWKFFSHARRGIYSQEPVATNAHAVLLTLDSWVQMSAELRDDIIVRAKKLLDGEMDITDADMRPVVFCSIQELSDILFVSNEDDILASFANAVQKKYRGWGLREVRRDSGGENESKEFPLKIENLLPWWGTFTAS